VTRTRSARVSLWLLLAAALFMRAFGDPQDWRLSASVSQAF